jgi:heme o synthase
VVIALPPSPPDFRLEQSSMPGERSPSPTRYRRLALAASALVIGLITLGGVVRITGSGLGCGDHWPLCDGQWFPPLDLPTLIEISHRWVAGLVTIAVFALFAVAWRRHRTQPELFGPALAAAILLVIQILLGPVIVKLDLPPAVVIVHLLNAMVLLGVLVVAVLRASPGSAARRLDGSARPSLVHLTASVGFVTIALGALTANLDAGMFCLGFPLCSGGAAPPATTLGLVQWIHRLSAFTLLGLTIALAVRSSKWGRGSHQAAMMVLGLVLCQIAVAAFMILHLLPTTWRALHLLVGTLVWVSLVVLVYRSGRMADVAVRADRADASGRANSTALTDPTASTAMSATPSLLADLITLTKPRIISLLLVTTVAPMFITGHGMPNASLVFWVCVGGYLMAGGANAINMWFDRDIDDRMTRTRLRPIPAGRISPAAGLLFGITLGALAFWTFWQMVNPLSAWLALGGLLFYVLVYTMMLKRWTPQNIVIGGAAGAFPPLVGWAAVAGSLDLAALYLFAIIFFWTPPHFWALALLKQGDYAKAGVPMMPNVGGEQWTKVQMLAYTLMLLPLTVMPSVFGALGLFYALAAAVLGGRLLWYCFKLLREAGVTPTAWKMYKYSLLYLALLFVAMGIDRALPFGHQFERSPILILDKPDVEAIGAPDGGR